MKNSFDKRTGKKVKNSVSVGSSSYSFDYLFDKFYHAKSAEGLAEKTLEGYIQNYKLLVEYLDENKIIRDVRNINAEVIRSYISYMLRDKIKFEGSKYKKDKDKTKGLSPVTVNARIKHIRTMFRFLYNEEYIDTDPLKNVKKVEEPQNEIKILTIDQIRLLLNTPDKRTYAGFRDYVLINVLMDGFFRISEALSLQESDLDFDVGMILLSADMTKGKRSRVVPLQKSTLKMLKELIKENEEFDNEYIFLANYGEPLTPQHFRNRLKTYVKDAKITCRVHPHLFRHTAATLFLEAGGDIRHLQMILGHRDLRMVIKYTHLSKESLKNQHEQYSPINTILSKHSKSRKIKR